MSDQPSWKDLIDMVSDAINSVDENSKRENDKLREDITLLRGELNSFRQELNDNRKDTMLSRTEMANLRTDMAELKSELKEQMIVADNAQCGEIELIKQQATIDGDRKTKIVAAVVFVATTIAGIVGKLLGIV